MAITIDDLGNVFSADDKTGEIYRFTPNGTRSTFGSGLTNPTSMAFAPPPKVKIRNNGGGVTISRPKFATEYRMESSKGLGTNDWGDVEVPAGASEVTLSGTESSQFFRLRK